ncbi:hypothetical protein PoMZ_09921, partial [Pyricularia oryzae]
TLLLQKRSPSPQSHSWRRTTVSGSYFGVDWVGLGEVGGHT